MNFKKSWDIDFQKIMDHEFQKSWDIDFQKFLDCDIFFEEIFKNLRNYVLILF